MPAGHQRILRATTAKLSWQPLDSDGEPAALVDDVTVEVIRADGTVVIAAGTPTSGAGSDPRTVNLGVALTADLDVLTARWSIGAVMVGETGHDIVGGYFFTITDLREEHTVLDDEDEFPTDVLLARRAETETFFESCTRSAFVPRFTTATIRADPGGVLFLPCRRVRRLRWARTADGGTVDVEDRNVEPTGRVVLDVADRTVVTVGFERGFDTCPSDIVPQAMLHTRIAAHRARTGIPARTESMVTVDGATVHFGRAGTEWRPTGVESIDEVLRRPEYDERRGAKVG